tara:strand:- start:482 stop:781 length:300 start_codon:yes stop_codon:yes gene_type:complete
MSKWTHFHFDLEKVKTSDVYAAEDELGTLDVGFDTATAMKRSGLLRNKFLGKTREWHTDWSLRGPMSVADIASFLVNKRIAFSTVLVEIDIADSLNKEE